MTRRAALLSACILFAGAAAAGFFVAYRYTDASSSGRLGTQGVAIRPDARVIGSLRPDFSLPDLSGRVRYAGEWDGRVLAVNFWATWCPPCRKEIPEFIRLQEKYGGRGLQFVGIALEQPEAVRSFVAELGMNYPVLTGTLEVVRVAEAYGNNVGALPFTAIIDRAGIISFIRAGPLSGQSAEAAILPLL